MMAGGRRTAAIVAAQYLKRIPCISTVYAGSSESRALMRISERGVTKSILAAFSKKEVSQICQEHNLEPRFFQEKYVVISDKEKSVCIFQATYSPSSHARPPDDGKLREINPDPYWLTVGGQHILPKPGDWNQPPLSLNIIYN